MSSPMRRLAQMVYNMNTVKRTSRVRMLNQTITEADATATNSFALLTCDDDPNYDLTTDGTNVAEVQPGTRLIAIQLILTISSLVTSRTIEWVIGRDPDGAITSTNFTIGTLFNADVSTNSMAMRKNTWTAGHIVGSDRTAANININISPRALARASRLENGDVIRLHFTDAGEGAGNAIFYLRGRFITRGP